MDADATSTIGDRFTPDILGNKSKQAVLGDHWPRETGVKRRGRYM